MLVDGERAVLIGGYGADYDLATPVSIDAEAVHAAGGPPRLVLPTVWRCDARAGLAVVQSCTF
jgi:hypothetical protein